MIDRRDEKIVLPGSRRDRPKWLDMIQALTGQERAMPLPDGIRRAQDKEGSTLVTISSNNENRDISFQKITNVIPRDIILEARKNQLFCGYGMCFLTLTRLELEKGRLEGYERVIWIET